MATTGGGCIGNSDQLDVFLGFVNSQRSVPETVVYPDAVKFQQLKTRLAKTQGVPLMYHSSVFEAEAANPGSTWPPRPPLTRRTRRVLLGRDSHIARAPLQDRRRAAGGAIVRNEG